MASLTSRQSQLASFYLIVTCSALADSYSDYSQTFNTILASFKVPTEGHQGSGILLIAIFGGVVGCLLFLVKKYQGT